MYNYEFAKPVNRRYNALNYRITYNTVYQCNIIRYYKFTVCIEKRINVYNMCIIMNNKTN